MVIILEPEARSCLPKEPNPAPAAGTKLLLHSDLRMSKQPGFSSSFQHPLRTCSSERTTQSSQATVLLWKTLVSAPVQLRIAFSNMQRVKLISATG